MPKKHTPSNKVRKRRGKDLDEILEDMKPEKIMKLKNQEVDLDLPGDGQFYCVECNRYFMDDAVLEKHKRTKVHKQRVKALKAPAYTQAEAEAAGGLGG
ncbi:zinc-finger double-stranded RNA-binding domain-containing protein [Ditylenchus destructor]|nr:zinc-finger double-stranded RNA-binding domain-containing protein [Ditylenchus destructor]